MDESRTPPPVAKPPIPIQTPTDQPTNPKSFKRSRKPLLVVILAVVTVLILAGIIFFVTRRKAAAPAAPTSSQQSTATTTQGLTLDPNKNYGNKYATGLLPVGDGKLVTDAAKTGYVYACSGYANNTKNDQGGAGSRGPWFTNNNTQYDINKKLHVQGSVSWQSSFSNKLTGATRTITTNDLPNHPTGTFPIAHSDPAYSYDRNPNSIKAQSISYGLNGSPAYGSPQCMGGEAGIMLTGVALFNGFDAGARDAGAWEIQDSCSGHPQMNGEYHYHTLSSCITDTNVKTVIGYALDGFPITGPKVGDNNVLTTSDLDECHGLTSAVTIEGKTVTTYHYVMTQDFPYSVSCFRSQPIQPPHPG